MWLHVTSEDCEMRRGTVMKATRMLYEIGQSLWLDNITRDLLDSGKLRQYIEGFSVTGLTSNPTIFERAFKNTDDYDAAIRQALGLGKSCEDIFFDLAIGDLRRAADLLRPIHEQTNGVDGWVSLEVSPLLARDAGATLQAAKELFARAARPNLMIKIPGTRESLPAVEEAIFLGIPVNVTLLFSREHYVAAAGAFLSGIERRVDAGLQPSVGSVASVFVSRWDFAIAPKVPDELRNRLGIAMAKRIYKTARALLTSPRWQRIYNLGARPQRLLWASTGTKDPSAWKALYVDALPAPLTVNTMPEETLNAVAKETSLGPLLPTDGGDCEQVLARFTQAGVDLDDMAGQLQQEGADSFAKSWDELMAVIALKAAVLNEGAYGRLAS